MEHFKDKMHLAAVTDENYFLLTTNQSEYKIDFATFGGIIQKF